MVPLQNGMKVELNLKKEIKIMVKKTESGHGIGKAV